ncbi:A disintegrin and metallopeptidase domain 3-like isoform X4 [Marmota marmota marmota]|uniref:A disintegrin and metallopeptidase domain 3-like isoform X4 n=1 Tax=Marmota marmota marmota TaxID=9994 RepID=UPI0020933CDD|nr:A disintegrin and metallopeptidase domain 3-like isoform X4 [Marmota marmota marmota]
MMEQDLVPEPRPLARYSEREVSGSKSSLLQITVPEKFDKNTNRKDVTETHVTYSITIEEKTYILSLKKQSYLAPNFPVFSYSKWGSLQEDSLFVKGDCFYQGNVEDIPQSAVTLDVCSGLRGFLLLENVSYGIEPLESSAVFEHMIYQINNDQVEYPLLTEGYSKPHYIGQPYRILVKTDKTSEITLKTTLKVQIIIDKAMFEYMDSDIDVAAEKVIHIIGLINTMFSRLKMTVMLSSLEIWSDQNKISTNGSADEVLQRFLSWKQTYLSSRSNNMAYLLIYKDHPNFVGATYHGMACDPKFSAGILLHPRTISLEAFSIVLAQLIGINLGLAYDDLYNCYCPESTCIMNPGAIQSQGVKVFSRCSTDVFKQIISQPQFGCLRKKKLLSQLTAKQSPPACGNGVVEIGEDCDCGKPEVCKYTKCCNAKSCTFTKPNLECGSGPCCNPSSCTLYERGHLCRRSRDDCDFAEFCNGTSEFCMPDVKAANLEPCHNYTAYCLYGLCRDPSRQCKDIFGRYALNAPYICIEEVNFQNDKFGNCGKSCNFGFILCGKVVCSYGHTEVADMKDYDFQYTYLAGHVCVSAHLRNTSRPDDTYAHTANPCDEDRSCHGRSCVLVHEHPFKAPCNSHEQCKGHGDMLHQIVKNYCHHQEGASMMDFGFHQEFLHREETVSGGSTMEDSNTNSTES